MSLIKSESPTERKRNSRSRSRSISRRRESSRNRSPNASLSSRRSYSRRKTRSRSNGRGGYRSRSRRSYRSRSRSFNGRRGGNRSRSRNREENRVSEGGKKVFVGNLEPVTDEIDFEELFSKYGELEDIYIPRDRGNRQNRGFGFITFKDAHDAKDACKESGNQLRGARIRVNLAMPRPGGDRKQGRTYLPSRDGITGSLREFTRRGRGGSRSRSRSPSRRRYRSRSRSRGRRYRSRSR